MVVVQYDVRRHLAAEFRKLCLNHRAEGILNAPVEHLVAGRDKTVFPRSHRHKAHYRLVPGKQFCLLHALLCNDKGYDARTAELVALFHHEAGVPCGYHHVTERIYGAKPLKVNEQQTVNIRDKLYLALLGRRRVHILVLADAAEYLRRLVLMEHILVLFPDIDIVLADRQKHRYVLFGDDMPLAEYRVLGHALDYLRDVMAQHMTHCVLGFDKLH